jgi:hypothetical protein
MRAWGIYLIPREKAPDEGYLLTRNNRGRVVWRAHHVSQVGGDGVPPARKEVLRDSTLEDLIDRFIENDELMR